MITPKQAAEANAAKYKGEYERQEARIDRELAKYNGLSVREVMVDMQGVPGQVVDMVRAEYGKHWAIVDQNGDQSDPEPYLTFSPLVDAEACHGK